MKSANSRRTFIKQVGGSFIALQGLSAFSALANAATARITPDAQSVLLVIDVQNCFLPGGTLPVKDGDTIIPTINALSKKFDNIVLTQDWHTAHHSSFASSHEGKKPYDTTTMSYGEQVLWPDHCVQGSEDAQLASGLNIPHAQLVIRKGYNSEIDSYSAFFAADKKTKTGLTSYLRERGINKVYVCGLATDFCVAWSALDARKNNFDVYVIDDAVKGIDLNNSVAKAWQQMKAAGVKRISSTDFA